MAFDPIKPTSATDTSGHETINKSVAEGLVVGDGTTGRVLVGFQKDGFGIGKDYGIKVSQDGYEVKTATDAQLVMSSAFNMFKIVGSGTASVSVTSPALEASTTVTHNLGTVPGVMAFVEPESVIAGSYPTYAGGYNAVPSSMYIYQLVGVTNVAVPIYFATYEVSSTNIILRVFQNIYQGGVGTYTYNFKYYLFQETAN